MAVRDSSIIVLFARIIMSFWGGVTCTSEKWHNSWATTSIHSASYQNSVECFPIDICSNPAILQKFKYNSDQRKLISSLMLEAWWLQYHMQ